MKEAVTSCRICAGQCSLIFTLDSSERIVGVRGDKTNPVTQGYACIKGLYAHEAIYSPQRILHPLKRRADGSFERIELERALDEIASQLATIIECGGADAVAGFRGTMNYSNASANRMLPDWLKSIGSSSFFSTMTVDQSAKWVTFERLGGWAAGKDSFDDAEVLMFVGTNPLVSLSTFNFALQHPVNRLREFKQRGGRLIVIDPRRTETARHADLFLQPLPGEDVTLMAALIHTILREGWHDAQFCRRYVNGIEALRAAVAPFEPAYAARRCGIGADEMVAAAKLFAHDCRRGSAASGTGPNMAPHSNLAEHMVELLNVICGRYARAGDTVPNPGVVGGRIPRIAQVIAPRRGWARGEKSRIRGLGQLFGEKMSAALAQEITIPGRGRVRALIVDGGNPASCIPDQRRIVAALRDLELLVCIEPFMTNTAQLAHYIIPPKLMYERFDLPSRDYETIVVHRPYVQFAVPIVEPPAGSEVVDDWYPFWALAKRLGYPVTFDGVALDMTRPPSTEQLLAILARHSSIPFEELRAATSGSVFPVPPMTVLGGPPETDAKFDAMPADVSAELAAVRAQTFSHPQYPYRLAVRRMREVQNSMYRQLPAIHRRTPYNPVWIHPEDLVDLSIAAGTLVEIRSPHGAIRAICAADDSLRRGVIAISHTWGALPDSDERYMEVGTNTNLLIDSSADPDPINAMPRMSAIPVALRRTDQSVN
jgi:anaerobic selenocysteine-containing dehydrogenase